MTDSKQTSEENSGSGRDEQLRRLFSTVSIEEPVEEIPGATHWPGVSPTDAPYAWEELRAWVTQLQERFTHLDHHIIPRCWWQHNEHVEALVALRDHERSSFSDTAPATAPLDWFRALRDIASLLRTWTAEQSCGASHQNPPTRIGTTNDCEWEQFITADVEHRRSDHTKSRLL